MGIAQDLVNAGYYGYQGWGDAEAQADFNATGGVGKGGGGGGIPTFDFDFAAEAEKAYGELGVYYDRILKETRGDVDKALSRLVEDYDRGLRIKTEDTDQALINANRQVQNNALRRGIFSKSLFDPSGGRGIFDETQKRATQPIEQSKERFIEGADIQKSRTETDLAEGQKRREFELEQNRRKEAAALSETRGERAFRKFSANLV